MKPGWKTTEFWGKIALQIFALWGGVKGFVSPDKAVAISAILESLYGIGRNVVKLNGGDLPDIPKP